jgi:CysZ protein
LNKHPRLWGWVVAPAAVTLVLLVAMIIGVLRLADSLVARVSSWLPDAIAGVGGWVIWVIVIVALVIGGLLVFVSVAGIVAGPFNELLSEAVEEQVTGKRAPGFSIGAFATSALRGIGHGIKRVVLAILAALLVFALGFVPVVGTIAALLIGGYFTARGAAYDCYDAVLSRRDMPYDAKTAYLAANRNRTFGLGAVVARRGRRRCNARGPRTRSLTQNSCLRSSRTLAVPMCRARSRRRTRDTRKLRSIE